MSSVGIHHGLIMAVVAESTPLLMPQTRRTVPGEVQTGAVRTLSLAEQGSPNAYHGGSLLDRNRIVGRHAHRQTGAEP